MFSVGGHSFVIAGYMVWCALGCALGGSWLAWRIGRPRISFNSERYAREAELRFRVNDSPRGSRCTAVRGASVACSQPPSMAS